jgi:hypothetical protein
VMDPQIHRGTGVSPVMDPQIHRGTGVSPVMDPQIHRGTGVSPVMGPQRSRARRPCHANPPGSGEPQLAEPYAVPASSQNTSSFMPNTGAATFRSST